MSNLLTSPDSTGKKWYQRPENLTSAIILSIVGFVGYKYGAALLSGILSLGGFLLLSGVIAAFIAFFVTQRRMVGTVWNVLMYKLTNAIYSIDPIAIAWAKLDNLKEKKDKINKAVEKIKGGLYNVTAQINTNNKEFKKNEESINALNKMGNKELEVRLMASDNVRLEQWNKDLLPLQVTMTNMQAGLVKLYDAANFVIRDKESELTMLEKRYKSVKIGWAAVKEAQGIYGNSKDRQELESLISMADTDMNNKLAEMDRFMEMAAPVFMEADIEKNIHDVRVQEMINKVTKGELDKVIDNMTGVTPAPKKVTQGGVLNTLPVQKDAVEVPKESSSGKYNLD